MSSNITTNEFEVRIYRMGSGYVQTRYLDPKTGKRKRKRFSTLREAKAYKKQLEHKIRSRGISAFNDLRISQAMKEYLEKFPHAPVRSRGNHFKSFIDKFGAYKADSITTSDLQIWMGENQKSDSLSSITMN